MKALGSIRLFCRLALPVLIVLAPAPVLAQLLPGGDATAEPAAAPDALGRETPRGAVTGLLDALAARNYGRAASYFATTEEQAEEDADENESSRAERRELARQLQGALDAGGTLLPFGVLSNDPTGRLDDSLPPDVEQVGTLGGNGGVPILLTRAEGPEGVPIWRISHSTIQQLETSAPSTRALSESQNGGIQIAGARLRDWTLLLGIAAGSFFLFWLISAGVLALMRSMIRDHAKSPIYRLTFAALPPLSLFLAVVSFQLWAGSVEASIVARQTLLRYIGIFAWIALAWFALRLVDAIARVATARMERHERRQAVSIVALARRAAKVLLLAMAFVAILDTFGFDVTAGIAALGIGGIALALGAQKTVENLVGSVTVIADRPVQVGDFCRVGDVIGTVEDIGMRSTRIRTLERTLVTIPNGDFSSREIENYATRDRFLFNPIIGLTYGISAAKLREGVEIIEQVLLDHELIDNEGMRVKFINFGASSLDIEVWSYITVTDYAESRGIRQELLLEIVDRLEAAGLSIAFPTRTVHLVRDDEE